LVAPTRGAAVLEVVAPRRSHHSLSPFGRVEPTLRWRRPARRGGWSSAKALVGSPPPKTAPRFARDRWQGRLDGSPSPKTAPGPLVIVRRDASLALLRRRRRRGSLMIVGRDASLALPRRRRRLGRPVIVRRDALLALPRMTAPRSAHGPPQGPRRSSHAGTAAAGVANRPRLARLTRPHCVIHCVGEVRHGHEPEPG
jgi:hypothetical protein